MTAINWDRMQNKKQAEIEVIGIDTFLCQLATNPILVPMQFILFNTFIIYSIRFA